jgi:hypothetical protein
VRTTPSWPRSWTNFSPLSLYPHRNAWANLDLLGQPNTLHATATSSAASRPRCRRRWRSWRRWLASSSRKVRKKSSWPRSWANFSLLSLHSYGTDCMDQPASFGQPNTFLAQGVAGVKLPTVGATSSQP